MPAGPHKQIDMFLASYACYKRGQLEARLVPLPPHMLLHPFSLRRMHARSEMRQIFTRSTAWVDQKRTMFILDM